MDQDVRTETMQRERARGLVYEPDDPASLGTTVRVWVKTWTDLIEEVKRRLEHFRENLQHNASIDDARQYLATHHGDVIPEGLIPTPHEAVEDTQPVEAETGESTA